MGRLCPTGRQSSNCTIHAVTRILRCGARPSFRLRIWALCCTITVPVRSGPAGLCRQLNNQRPSPHETWPRTLQHGSQACQARSCCVAELPPGSWGWSSRSRGGWGSRSHAHDPPSLPCTSARPKTSPSSLSREDICFESHSPPQLPPCRSRSHSLCPSCGSGIAAYPCRRPG